MNDESRELINAFVKLCGTRTTIEDAKTLPERFKAVIDWQGDLSAFVLRFPQVLKNGVSASLDEEARQQVQQIVGWRS